MLNEKMITTGLYNVGSWKNQDRKDVRKRHGGIVLRMTWKVYVCPKRMHSPGINGEGELRGQPANQVHLENGR